MNIHMRTVAAVSAVMLGGTATVITGGGLASASTQTITHTYSCAPLPGGAEICAGVDHEGAYVEDAQVQLYYPTSISGISYFIVGQNGTPNGKDYPVTPNTVSGSGWLPQGNANIRKDALGQWCGIAEGANGYYVQACVNVTA